MPKEIRHEITLMYSAEMTYRLLTHPRYITRWLCDAAKITPDGFHIWQYKANGELDDFHTTILEEIPYQRVVMETDDMRMLQTRYLIHRQSDQSCRLEILESGFTADAFGEMTYRERQESWQSFLQRLQCVTLAEAV